MESLLFFYKPLEMRHALQVDAFPLTRRKKRRHDIGQKWRKRHFRPMESLLFFYEPLEMHSVLQTDSKKKKNTFHWSKVTYYVTFDQWNK